MLPGVQIAGYAIADDPGLPLFRKKHEFRGKIDGGIGFWCTRLHARLRIA